MENSSFIEKALQHGIPVLITWLFILAGTVEAVWDGNGERAEGATHGHQANEGGNKEDNRKGVKTLKNY